MTYRIVLCFLMTSLFFSNCNLFETPAQVSFTAGINHSSFDEFVIYSKPNGKLLYHQQLSEAEAARYDDLRNSTLHLTHCHLVEGDNYSHYHFTTFTDIPAGNYEAQSRFVEIGEGVGLTFYIDVKNIGSFNPVQGENPFYSVIGQTISYDSNANGGHLVAKVLGASERHGYVSFNINGERRYFYANNIQHEDTIYVDYTTLPTLPNVGQITLDDTYTNSWLNVMGYIE